MNTDLTTRILLAGILVCLALLVLQGMGTRPSDAGAGRYQVDVVNSRRGVSILRTDTETGQMWRSEDFPGEARWVRLSEPGEGEATPKPSGDE
jgi:hypothetical protein